MSDLEYKFRAIQQYVGVPMMFIASTAKVSQYRKPQLGMWNLLAELINVKAD